MTDPFRPHRSRRGPVVVRTVLALLAAFVLTLGAGVATAQADDARPEPTPCNAICKVIGAASSQTGRGYSYSWGAGNKHGPTYGVCCSPSGYDDRNRFGYDCSGLTQFAFWRGAHVDIGTTSTIQYTKGTKHPYRDRKAGDLIFWGQPGAMTHVAIYIGEGYMFEAAPPRGTHSVHRTRVYGGHYDKVVRIRV